MATQDGWVVFDPMPLQAATAAAPTPEPPAQVFITARIPRVGMVVELKEGNIFGEVSKVSFRNGGFTVHFKEQRPRANFHVVSQYNSFVYKDYPYFWNYSKSELARFNIISDNGTELTKSRQWLSRVKP